MHADEYRDAYDHPRPARVPRLGRQEAERVPEVTPEAERAGEGHTAPIYASPNGPWPLPPGAKIIRAEITVLMMRAADEVWAEEHADETEETPDA